MSAASMSPWESVARRAADSAVEASHAASRCEGMFVQLSKKLNEHVTECRALREAQGHAPAMPSLGDLEPDEITQHGTKRYRLTNAAGREVTFTHEEIETLKSASAVVREAKRYAWRHAIPWAIALGLGALHLLRYALPLLGK